MKMFSIKTTGCEIILGKKIKKIKNLQMRKVYPLAAALFNGTMLLLGDRGLIVSE
jgi:hypothetical protein